MHKLKPYIILSALSVVIFFSGIATLPVTDRDEAYFAQATRQMMQTGNYFQIRFQEQTRFQKPPGINWLQAASVHLFSNANEASIWPYRLPSVFGGLLSVLILYYFASQLMPKKAALLAASLLGISALMVIEAHLAVIDALLLVTILLMQLALWFLYKRGINQERGGWGWVSCFWVAMALGLVLKGVTILVGLLTIVCLCFMEKNTSWLSSLHLWRGLLLLIILTLAWLIPVSKAENSNYLLEMLHRDLLPKLAGGHESHGKPPLFHLLMLPLTFWPGSLFLWQGGVFACKHRQRTSVKFLLAWLLPAWAFFEIMPTKLPQYVLPMFPALAMLCALAIAEYKNEGKETGLRILQILWGIGAVSLAFLFPLLSYQLMQRVSPWCFILLGGSIVSTLVTLYFAWRRAYYPLSLLLILTAVFCYPLIFIKVLPQLKPLWFTETVFKILEPAVPEKPLLVSGFSEPSLVFNLDTSRVKFSDAAVLEKEIKRDPNRLALISKDILSNWQQKGLSLAIKAKVQGFNYTKGRWIELFLVANKQEI